MGFFSRLSTSDRAKQHFQVGMAAYQSGSFERAINEFTAAIEVDPELVPPRYQRGMAFGRCGDERRAIDDFQWVAEHSMDRGLAARARFNLAHGYEQLGELERAAKEYGEVVELDPSEEKALCNRGSVLNRLERFPEAVEDLSRAIELDPSDALAYWNRAIANNALGHGEEVREDVEQFLRLAPPDHPYRRKAEELIDPEVTRASPMLDRQRQREIRRLVERIIELNNQERYAEALEVCERALGLEDALEVVWDEKTYALTALGRADEAQAVCERGLATIPEAVRLRHTHALMLDQQGRHREALAEYRKYVEAAPPEYGQVVSQSRERIDQLEGIVHG